MDLKGFIDKAKDAAAIAAKDIASSAAKPAVEMNPAASSSAEEGEVGASPEAATANGDLPAHVDRPQSVSAAAAQKFSELKALGAEKVQALVASFQRALPAIKLAGYELTELEIELGITPKLIPHFRHTGTSAENVERANDAVRDNKLGALLLGALLKAGDVHKQINVAGFRFSHVEIELGLIPAVRLQYKGDGAGAEIFIAPGLPVADHAQLPAPGDA
jgi:hypothetical protein